MGIKVATTKKNEKIKKFNNIYINIKEENNNYKVNKKTKKNTLYNNFDINKKRPILVLQYHTNTVWCLILLKDGRIASGSADKSIIIYNKITYKPDLIIKEHKNLVSCLTELTSGVLASSSWDKTIKLYNINGKKYKIIQTLNYHKDFVNKIIELKNKQLISYSDDKSIIIYSKKNNKYKKDYKILTENSSLSVVQTKFNEICFNEEYEKKICFYDIFERKKKKTINNIKDSKFLMIREDLLLIGENKISLINVNQYSLIRVIEASEYILSMCLLNENTILIGGYFINQYRIEGDNIILISDKKNAHKNSIYSLLNLSNGHFASGSLDTKLKIW